MKDSNPNLQRRSIHKIKNVPLSGTSLPLSKALARTEGGSSNTFPVRVINDAILRSLIKLVDGLHRLGFHDENSNITYREDETWSGTES